MKKAGREVRKAFYNRSLERALQIVTVFAGDRRSLTLAQLSETLGLSKATVFRLCTTLMKYGFLRQDQELKQYSLGIKLFELGSIVASSFSLARVASPHLTALQMALGKTVFLTVLDDGELLYVDKREGLTEAITFTSQIGKRRPPYWGMLGQTLMAYLTAEEVDRLLEKSPLVVTTKKSFTSREELDASLRLIREQGYAVDEGRSIEGVGGVAAPVRDYTGKVVASAGVGFIYSSVGPDEMKEIVRRVVATAQAISVDAGYSAP